MYLTHRQHLCRPIVAGLLLVSVAVQAWAEAKRVGNLYIWRNELETDVFVQEAIVAWVPDTAATVRGFFFHGSWGGCPGADARPWAQGDTAWQAYAAELGFGLLGTTHMCGSEYNPKNTNLLKKALVEMGAVGPNTEIANVPLIPWANSNAAAAGYTLACLMPEKILCAWLNVPARFIPSTPSDGAMKVPTVLSTGENDPNHDALAPIVRNARSRGGLWAWTEVEDMGHNAYRVFHVGRSFFEKCIALRYPPNADPKAGPIQLIDIDERSGWLADDTWRTQNFAGIYPYNEFPGNKSTAQWHIDKDIAFMSRGLASWNDQVSIEMYVDEKRVEWDLEDEFPMVARPGAQARMVMATNGFVWDSIQVYRGATRIASLTTGLPEYTFALQAGELAQTYAMLAYGGSDVQSDMPHGVVVIDANSSTATAQSVAPQVFSASAAPPAQFDLLGRPLRSRAAAPAVRLEVGSARGARVLVSTP